jgi:8-oxo-dGTP pyrophosphatase MutT (NUDIX family)
MEIEGEAVRVALAVILHNGRVLVARKHGARFFTLPGGKPEADETPLACLQREIEEELGVRFAKNQARALGSFAATAANEPDRRVEAEVFLLDLNAEPGAQAEIEALRWHPVDDDAADLAPLLREQILPRLRGR